MAVALATAVIGVTQTPAAQSEQNASSAEQRAVAYLADEVERWPRENRCFSCHNNGDGARALYAAVQRGFAVPETALEDSTRWLLLPPLWESAAARYPFGKKTLAVIQFAATLVEALDAGIVRDRKSLATAGELLLASQQADGSWQVDAGAMVGAPATYGPVLATAMARRVLERARDGRQDGKFDAAIAKANAWLLAARPNSILDTAALVRALPTSAPERKEYAELILRAQNGDGGWGPYASRPSEPFDTAVVLLALGEWDERERVREPIGRGRAFLLAEQFSPGGWPETTRPAGNQSYAEHISTSAWATLALLLTQPER